MKRIAILIILATIPSRVMAIANDGVDETDLGTEVVDAAQAEEDVAFVAGQIIVKIDPDALPISPIGDSNDA